MTLRMAKLIRMEDIERLLGPCGADGALFRANYPDGIDLTTAAGQRAVQALYDQGLAVEFGLAVVLDQEQRTRFIGRLVEERKALLGVTTQEEIAEIIYPGEDPAARHAQERKETAVGIMVDIGTEGRARDLLLALRATEKARQILGDGDTKGIRDRGLAWFRQEVTDAVRDGRVRE